ncbi:stage III sporulation protein SpoIIIAB [Gracilibacillus dipsosauri]|uniref:Stage III sporulation protein SpoAB n=1 Tax=Gracilibacillus dipsosauri TaxID=178340 RepID=A0A317KZ90_9BACI|nr:stage III sporulation protein SpoIIIAB [Gracilibacillus dipsosauri]PWU68546.1 stage III sporulation protein SpoAB [Gracilibacillus dipsosauri]
MKWIGAILIIITFFWIGIEFANRMEKRPKLIRTLKNALLILEAEIVYSQTAVQDACIHISKQVPQPIALFFEQVGLRLKNENRELYSIWEQEVELFWNSVPLFSDEKEIMKQFGRTLGQHDTVQQQKYIQLALTHLNNKHTEAEEMYQRYGKISKSLGFLTGILIALLLL